jgi:hypothetical protein
VKTYEEATGDALSLKWGGRTTGRVHANPPHPGVLGKEALQTPAGKLQAIENKGSECEEARREKTKRRQTAGDKRVERESTARRALRLGNLHVEEKNYRATQIDVKTKEL